MATSLDELIAMGQLPPLNKEITVNNLQGGIQQAPSVSQFQPARNAGLSQFLLGLGSAKLDQNAGFANNLNSLVSSGANQFNTHRQNVQNFNAYNPYFQKQGINTDALNPANGGAGFGEITPIKMLELQSTMENRDTNNLYRQALIQQAIEKTKNINTPKAGTMIKRSDVMAMNQPLKDYWSKQYDFSNGQNTDFLNQEIPVDAVKAYYNSLPKNYNINKSINNNLNVSGRTTKNIVKSGTSTSNINYSGGTHSTKDNYGSKNPRPKVASLPPAPTSSNQKIMTDSNGNRALVQVDKSGKAIKVIKEL